MNYREAYEWGVKCLSQNNVSETEDARFLLEYVCSTTRNDLYAHADKILEPIEEERYKACIEKRSQRIPLQHITGTQEFMGLEFKVSGDVLIPRQDTEILVEEAMRYLMDGERLLDMCTGSGCILLSIMNYKNDIQGIGADISLKALEIAKYNYEKLSKGINGKAEFIESNLFENITGQFDMIVSNPPYIKTEVIDTLESEVKDYDPMLALDGGVDGLDFYRIIISAAPKYLKAEGMLLVEIGFDQSQEVEKLFGDNGFYEVSTIKDYAGLDRVVLGRKG